MRKSETGTSFVEAAIVMPLLGLLLFGIIEYGYVLASYITLRSASAVAARVGVLAGASDADIRLAARDAISAMLDPALLPDGNITISRNSVGFNPPRISVTLVYNLPLIVNYAHLAGNGPWQLTATTVMR